jgi:UDPglucose 6-dehydrogenase
MHRRFCSHQVTCVDKDSAKISGFKLLGEILITSRVSKTSFNRMTLVRRLLFTTALGDALPGADAVFIPVGTPRRGDCHSVLLYIYEPT